MDRDEFNLEEIANALLNQCRESKQKSLASTNEMSHYKVQ